MQRLLRGSLVFLSFMIFFNFYFILDFYFCYIFNSSCLTSSISYRKMKMINLKCRFFHDFLLLNFSSGGDFNSSPCFSILNVIGAGSNTKITKITIKSSSHLWCITPIRALLLLTNPFL